MNYEECRVRTYSNGTKYWYNDKDELHRLDGPAVIHSNGYKEWRVNDKFHRLDGPALEYACGDKYWYKNGELHRTDGPAVEYANGYKRWYINDKELTEEEFNKQKPKKMKIVYVAGCYRSSTTVGIKLNIDRAEKLAMDAAVACEGKMYPLIPHCNTRFWEGLMSDEFFLEGTKEAMRRCDAVLVVPCSENSEGTKGEIAEAQLLEIPVFHDVPSLQVWLFRTP